MYKKREVNERRMKMYSSLSLTHAHSLILSFSFASHCTLRGLTVNTSKYITVPSGQMSRIDKLNSNEIATLQYNRRIYALRLFSSLSGLHNMSI